MSGYQDRWPTCTNPECQGRIYLTHNPITGQEREYCAACERAGHAPVTEVPPLPEPYSQRGKQ